VKPLTHSPPALRVIERDEAGTCLEDVYRRYAPYVAAVVLRLSGRRNEVEDLVQDVFVEATRGIGGLREPAAVKGWLATITVRLCRRRLRLRRLAVLLGLDAGFDYSRLVDSGASPVDRLLLAGVYRVLDQVPVEARMAFALHHLEGETLEEVARLCGCSLATAKRRVAVAHQRIRATFADVEEAGRG
jgi:RNA polymerase sigma-70 factor (ECF subfamily)